MVDDRIRAALLIATLALPSVMVHGCDHGTSLGTGKGGQVSDAATVSPSIGGSGSDGTGAPGAGGQAGGTGGTRTDCVGDLAAVSSLWGWSCEQQLCSDVSRATNCDNLPSVNRAYFEHLPVYSAHRVRYELSEGMRKDCYYAGGVLVGAVAYDSGLSFCDGTSPVVVAVSPGDSVDFDATPSRTDLICRRGSDEGYFQGLPPPGCYDVRGECRPCCPSPPPDCMDKADGYPGYLCQRDGYCSCECRSREWRCYC